MRRITVVAMAVAAGWGCLTGRAADGVHFTKAAEYEATEFANAVRIAGNTAYLTDGGAGLQILDISNPEAPVNVGTFDSDGYATEFHLKGNRGYLADGDQGMVILDLTNPTAPTVVGKYNAGVMCLDVKVVGNRAYLACADAGIQIVDITDPANPVKLSEFLPQSTESSPWANKLWVVGNTVYVSTSFLLVLDATDPTKPVEIGRWEDGVVVDCSVVGNRLYAATTDDGVVVFDVTNPAKPVRLTKRAAPGGAYCVQVEGNLVYTGAGVVDVTDPVSPVLLGLYPGFGWGDQGIAVSGNYVFLPSGATALYVFKGQRGLTQDVTWPAPEHRVIPVGRTEALGLSSSSGLPVTAELVSGPATLQDGQLTVTGPGRIELKVRQPGNATFLPVDETRYINERVALLSDLATFRRPSITYGARVSGGYAYLGNSTNGLVIVDVSNLAKPAFVSAVTTTNETFEADIAGGYAYVADGLAGLKVVDVRDPANPVTVAQRESGRAISARVVGNRAYLTDLDGKKLYIFDITDPLQPTQLSTADLPGDGRACYVVGNRVYVASGFGGVAVFDVTNPAAPVKESEFAGRQYVRGVAVRGNYAFVPDYYNGSLTAFDVSNPKAPVKVSTLDTEGYSRRLEISGDLAFFVAETGGLQVIDISNPASMLFLGSIQTGGGARDIQVDGSLLYVTDQSIGFRAFRLDSVGVRPGVHPSIPSTTEFGVPVPLAATVDSGLPVRFAVKSGPGRIEGNQLIPTGIGHIEVQALTDAASGYASGSETSLVLSTLPDVSIRKSGAALEAAWTAGLVQARLQGAGALSESGPWSDVAGVPTVSGGKARVGIDPAGGQGFLRLWHPFPGVAEPLAVTGWNKDVVLENAPGAKGDELAPFRGLWFEAGLDGFVDGLPSNREIRNSWDPRARYQLQPYTTNNVLMLTDEQPSNSLVLQTPTVCSRLFILSASDSERGTIGSLIVHYADGTQSDQTLWISRSWWGRDFSGNRTQTAFPGVGRSTRADRLTFSFGDIGFSMFQTEIDLSAEAAAGKAVARIEFFKSSVEQTVNGVYAVSGVRVTAQP